MKTMFLDSKVLVVGLLTLPLILSAGCFSSDLERRRDEIMGSDRGKALFEKGLSLTINSRKDTYKKGEPITIDYRITNITNILTRPGDINVYGELFQEGYLVSFDFRKVTGARSEPYASPKVDVKPDENIAAYSYYAKLPPGYFFGRPVVINSRPLDVGIYEMTARYSNVQKECLLSPDLAPDQIRLLQGENDNAAFVKLWLGNLKSNTIVFELKK